MKKIKTAYAYLFFFLYNTVNTKDNILVQWKSVFLILMLEFFCLFSVFIEYENITKKTMLPEDFNTLYFLFIIIPLIAIKVWFFERNENWKQYLERFNAWPEKKQKCWNWSVRIFLLLVLGNVILFFYWLSQINWAEYNPKYHH